MKLGIRTKLFVVSLAIVIVAVLVADAYLSSGLDALLTERLRADLLVRTNLVAVEAGNITASMDDIIAWDRFADERGRIAGARVTIIAADGRVIGDSELDIEAVRHVENHASRPEVKEALAIGLGTSLRFSSTVSDRMMYVAAPISKGTKIAGVVRVAMHLGDIEASIGQLHRIMGLAGLMALATAVLMSTFAAQLTSKALRAFTKTAAKMAAGDLSARTRAQGNDELAALGHGLDQLAENLSESLSALRRERDLLSGILAGMQEGVLVLDPAGRIVLVNAALREMLLLDNRVEGRSVLETIRNAELEGLLARVAKSGQREACEIDIPGIKPRRLLVHASALANPPAGRLAVCVDVTQLRRLESLRRDFVANVSHELRTPVASVRSAAETLRSALSDPEAAKRFVDIIDRNASRLHQLVDDLLDLSRIESREYRLSLEPMALHTVVERILSLFRERADGRGVELVNTIQPMDATVRADIRALEQVLTNLVDNAVKYCPPGARVSLQSLTANEWIRLAVVDSGPGIAPEHLSRLFERFYRVDPGRSRDLGGTGLGLSIVKHLVEAMGGTVTVESVVGAGTTFVVSLPRAGV